VERRELLDDALADLGGEMLEVIADRSNFRHTNKLRDRRLRREHETPSHKTKKAQTPRP